MLKMLKIMTQGGGGGGGQERKEGNVGDFVYRVPTVLFPHSPVKKRLPVATEAEMASGHFKRQNF